MSTTIPPQPDTARRNARKPRTAYASVFLPQGSRALFWLTFRCPVCGVHVFARCRQIDEVARPRKATCGHKVATVAARLYGGPEAS